MNPFQLSLVPLVLMNKLYALIVEYFQLLESRFIHTSWQRILNTTCTSVKGDWFGVEFPGIGCCYWFLLWFSILPYHFSILNIIVYSYVCRDVRIGKYIADNDKRQGRKHRAWEQVKGFTLANTLLSFQSLTPSVVGGPVLVHKLLSVNNENIGKLRVSL